MRAGANVRLAVALLTSLANFPSNAAVAKRPDPPKREDDPAGARRYFLEKRSPDGVSPLRMEWYLKARDRMSRMHGYSTRLQKSLPSRQALGAARQPLAALGTWSELGPGNFGGLVETLVIHPTTPAVMYTAGNAGGVWKTTNGGASWAPLMDLLPNLNVNALAMDPKNPNVLYAGTGDTLCCSGLASVVGVGIFKTIDGGANWTHNPVSNAVNFYVNKIAVSPLDSNRVYAATSTGIWRSLDAGANWTQVWVSAAAAGTLDLVIPGGQATDVIIATDGNFTQASIIRNPDAGGGGAWTSVYTEANMGRTSLAVAPSNPNVVYAMASSNQAGFQHYNLFAIYRSIDGGVTWTARMRNTDPTPLNLYLLGYATDLCFGPSQGTGQGFYGNVLAVDPLDANRVWAGGVDLYRSDDGGANWALASYWWLPQSNTPNALQYAHADQHAIVFHPAYDGVLNQTMFVGTDGGVFRTDNARGTTSTDSCANTLGSITWTPLDNGLGITQFYVGLPYPDGKTYFGGTQDNGTLRGSDAAGINGWNSILFGDGGYVALDETNTNVLFGSQPYLSLKKSSDGGVHFAPSVAGITEPSNSTEFGFVTPFVLDPGNPQNMWLAGRIPWRSTDQGANWTQAGVQFTTGSFPATAIAVAPTDSNYVLIGRKSGFIVRSTTALSNTAATVWPGVLPTSPAQVYNSSLTFDPVNKNIAYATFSSFGVPHVWKSIDAGATWNSIDGSGVTGIPDIPVHVLVVDPTTPSRLYAGSDMGVFTSVDGGAHWAVENTGFPNVITESLSAAAGQLFAFTYGRGAWRVPLVPPGALAVGCPSPTAQSGVPYASSLAATGGTGPYTYSIATGALPGGLNLDASTGAVAGTPAAGVFNFTAKVVDAVAAPATSPCTISVAQPPDLTVASAHTGSFAQGSAGATYTLTVSNAGGSPTAGTVEVTETVPAGLIATGIAGTGWTCTQPAGPCNRADALAGGASYPPVTLTVNVATTAPPTVVNAVTVAGGGETNTSNDSAADPTAVGGTPFSGLTPCRILDTRNPIGPLGGPILAAGQLRIFPVVGTCGIPLGTVALSVNATITGSTAPGTIQLFPGDQSAPTTIVVSFGSGATRGSSAFVAVSSDGAGTVAIRNSSSGSVHVILDVNGFFR